MTAAYLELPAFYIDEVVEDDLGLAAAVPYYLVINRDPEPGQVQIRTDTLIAFDLAAESGDSPDLTATLIFVSVTPPGGPTGPEVLVWDGNAFQSGWDGPDSVTSVIDASTTRFTIDPTSDFSSLDGVAVRVVSASTAAVVLAATSWTFTIEDVTAPVLALASGRSKLVVRLDFDEPIVQTAATNPDSALNPSNYLFERQTNPAVDVVASAISVVTTSSVDVELDIEQTPGATYRVTVSDIEDLFGNVVAAPFNTVEFLGFTPQIPEDRDFQLFRLHAQKNRDEDASGDFLKFTGALQEILDLLLCEIDRWTDILDPDLAAEQFLDCMLDDLGNPFDFDLTVTDKRRLIRILVSIYKQKGTSPGIVNVVRFFLGIEVVVNSFSAEGWELGIDELGGSGVGEEGTAILGPGTSFGLYSFEIAAPIILTQEQRDRITDIANYMKPAHTHLIQIVEPETPTVIDHLELGLSELSPDEWILH